MVMPRPWAGAPWPERGLDLALYFGEVVYGNVGAARRLDLTIIGPTVNEASRIAALRAACGRRRFVSRHLALSTRLTIIPHWTSARGDTICKLSKL